ncbi:MAG: response regulator [Planctomycetia bacterium]|nr:response regulator [Planctomycetia bacterium]
MERYLDARASPDPQIDAIAMQAPIRILLVEDNSADAEGGTRAVTRCAQDEFEVIGVTQLSDAMRHLDTGRFDVVLLDLGLPTHSGIEALQEVRSRHPRIPIVVLTDVNDEAVAQAALRHGAQDFLTKQSLSADSLSRSIRYCKRAEAALEEQIHLSLLTARVSVILTRRESLPTMLRECCDVITRQLGAAFTRIWTLNAEREVLELQASAGIYTHLGGAHARVPVGQWKIGRIAQDRQPLLTNAVIGDPCVHDQEWAAREGMVAFAGYPLVCEDRLVGVIALFARQALSDVTIHALDAVSDGIAMGIERCRVADELRASRERFELAVRGSTDGLWDWNILTGDAYMSPRLAQMLGYADGELEKRFSAWVTRLHPDDREGVLAMVQRHLTERRPFVVDHRLQTKCGEYRWFCARGQALWNDRGEAYRMAGSLTDITERVQMESVLSDKNKQLRHSQKLEAVGALAGGIAHEFNNLLQAICGYTRLAMEALPVDTQPRQDLRQVQKAADRATALTRQLLGFSRHQVLEPTVLDPSQVVGDLAKLLRSVIGEDIEVEVSLAEDVGTLHADPGLLQQMLLNLCINARDAMPSGGRLALTTKQVALGEAYGALHPPIEPGLYVEFSIADTGCGMSAEVKERIFEPFFTTKDVGRGTGLGLSMVYGTVQQHGGAIDVQSEPGGGTTFRIYLPVAGGVEAPTDQHLPAGSDGGSETILLAEDDPLVRQLAQRVLTQAGYSLLVAADGTEAIALLETHADDIALALLDAVMPNGTGREVHDRIKREKPEMPVVICTGYDPDAGQLEFLKKSGLRLIQKPFDAEVLLRIVRESLDAEPIRDAMPCLK